MLTELDVLALLRKRCAAAGGCAVWARDNGISPGYAADVLSGRTAPGPAVLKALALRRVVGYVELRKKGV